MEAGEREESYAGEFHSQAEPDFVSNSGVGPKTEPEALAGSQGAWQILGFV